ncbi:TPR repeat protein [Naegleria gruberi]|uniref:TPR repeat protein n=1 Tax=Naegleria gruberi TaxID=5762 RepID=D2V4M1_NAEGR|nr:TPR repeat protein [Naegleria gruberi]EFC47957.1 TPR repeat protein [Naegleria gruberi]|eukprot:XP_002680701.1 TPR repeat protein [Naegleria gruberi strain NEG-M]
MSLSILPQDLIYEVMKFLRVDQRIRISRVCQEFYHIIASLFPALELNLSGGKILPVNLPSFLSCPFLEQVTVLDLSENLLSEENIIAVANCERFKKLEELILKKNEFSLKCAEAFTKSSFIRQLKYIDLRNAFFVWKDVDHVEIGKKFITSQPQDLQNFWYLVLGNCGTEIVPEWLLVGCKEGNSKLHWETQLEFGEYLYHSEQNTSLAIQYFEELGNNPLAHNRAIAMYVLGKIYSTLGEKYHSKAFQLFLKAANLDDQLSYLSVANFYSFGIGIGSDPDEALKWYLKYAENSNDDDGVVAHQIGGIYFEYKKDIPQALKWWNKSAEKDNTEAQYSLGTIYMNGDGVEKDVKKGMALLEDSARLGNSDAQNTVGAIYLEGEDSIEIDLNKAKDFLIAAAEAEDTDALYNLGILAENEKRFEEAMQWYKKALDMGNTAAAYPLGRFYFQGLVAPKDEKKAIHYVEIAANNNSSIAQEYLGDIYHTKESEIYNPVKAIEWYTKAASNDSTNAMYNCGCINEELNNFEMALYWYTKAIEKGSSSAMNNLAMIYYEKKNYENAKKWIEKSVEFNNSYAICTMGEWYIEGLCYEKSYEKAVQLFTRSTQFTDESGDQSICPPAFLHLYKLYANGLGCEKDLEKAQQLLETAAKLEIQEAIEILEDQQSKKRKSTTEYDGSSKKMK